MDFKDFLREIQSRNKLATAADLFDFLGGESKIGIKKRNFYLIFQGKYAPTAEVFLGIFNQLDPEDYKFAIQAYFESAAHGTQSNKIKKYLNDALTMSYNEKARSIWEMGDQVKIISENQIDYLKSNTTAIRVFNYLLLNDRIPPSQIKENKDVLDQLIKLGLALREADGGVRAISDILKTPNYDDSPKSVAQKANLFVLKHIDAFYTGTPENENVAFVIGHIPKHKHKIILNQAEAFKKWIRRFAVIPSKKEDTVPFLYIGFAKKLENEDFGI